MFYCDGEQIQNDGVDAKLESYGESNNNDDEDPATTTGDNKKNKQAATKKPLVPVILADLWEENSDLKGDVIFLDSLRSLLSALQTSNHLFPFLNTFKRNCVVARRAIFQERIQQEKEKNNSNDDMNVDDANLDRLDEQKNEKNDSDHDTLRI